MKPTAYCVVAVMALVPVLPVYIAGCVLAMTTSAAAIALRAQIFQESYLEREDGRRFARAMMIRNATAALFRDLAWRALSHHRDRFPYDLFYVIRAPEIWLLAVLPPAAIPKPSSPNGGGISAAEN